MVFIVTNGCLGRCRWGCFDTEACIEFRVFKFQKFLNVKVKLDKAPEILADRVACHSREIADAFCPDTAAVAPED